jgi:hypothetical protein
MRERARKMHAKLRIESQGKGGTQVELRVPAVIAYGPRQAIRKRLWFIFGHVEIKTASRAALEGKHNDQPLI